MIKRLIIIITCSLIAAPVLAVGGVSLDPSINPSTARHLGMGGMGIGFSDDAGGMFYNPAGLAKIEFPQLTATSRKLVLDEVNYSLISCAMPTPWGTFGIGYVGLGTGGSLSTKLDPGTNRIIIDPSREATSYDNTVAMVTYSKQVKIPQLPNKISVGGNLKFFNQSLSGDITSRATGMGIGLGALYRTNEWLTVGGSLQNLLEGNMQWSGGESDKVGGNYKLGARVNILGSKEALVRHAHTLYGGIDMDIPHSTNTSASYHLGVEYYPMKKVALRTGLNMEGNGAGLNFGVGLENGGFRFDYAYAPRPGIPGDPPHYFTISYVGERVISFLVDKKPKRRESLVSFSKPKDRTITDKDSIVISAEAKAVKYLDKTTIYKVTAISETKEVTEIKEVEILNPVYLNGVKLAQVGSISATSPLSTGRNLFQITGFTSPESYPEVGTPEIFAGSAEVKVLRFIPFKDTPMDYWAIRPVALSVTLGLIKGYPGNTFKPEKGITRAELVTLLVRSIAEIDLDLPIEVVPFIDVKKDHWAAKHITHGSREQLVTGYPDGSFKPKKVLTRAEGVTILARYSGLIGENITRPPFPDLKEDYWANKYIAPAKAAGLLEYLKGKDFEPNKPFSRAEAAEVLYRTPKIQKRVNQYWETGLISAQEVKTREAPKPKEKPEEIKTKTTTGEAQPAEKTITKPATSEGK
ncbi:MAG: S-layer homology domain-containing protein [Candidatus Margulisiibacteriota bacterium]|nr:S-layer homology domain-containing protein [Candidatus Margulisiibacteriota bacterium]